MRIGLLLLLALLVTSSAAAVVEHRVGVLRFEAPDEAEVTRHTLSAHADGVAVSAGEEGLVLTVYTGKKRPSSSRALRTHLEELEVRLLKTVVEGSLVVTKESTRLLGRPVKGRVLRFEKHFSGQVRRYETHIAALRRGKLTLVTLWTSPVRDDATYFSPALLKTLTKTAVH